jgi:hypothetical protein
VNIYKDITCVLEKMSIPFEQIQSINERYAVIQYIANQIFKADDILPDINICRDVQSYTQYVDTYIELRKRTYQQIRANSLEHQPSDEDLDNQMKLSRIFNLYEDLLKDVFIIFAKNNILPEKPIPITRNIDRWNEFIHMSITKYRDDDTDIDFIKQLYDKWIVKKRENKN